MAIPELAPWIYAAVPLEAPLLIVPPPLSAIPNPPPEATLPSFAMVHEAVAGPSMPLTPEPVALTVPALVMVSGLSPVPRTTGPVVLLLMIFPAANSSMGDAVAALLGPVRLNAARIVLSML